MNKLFYSSKFYITLITVIFFGAIVALICFCNVSEATFNTVKLVVKYFIFGIFGLCCLLSISAIVYSFWLLMFNVADFCIKSFTKK